MLLIEWKELFVGKVVKQEHEEYNAVSKRRERNMLIKIKDFAAFCNVSDRALRLYDKLGLFHPAYIDPKNGYRYYDTEQMLELNTIISFKKVGFSLQEIKEMKEAGLLKEQVIDRLCDKRREQQRIVEVATYNIENINAMLKALGMLKESADEQAEATKLARLACLENEKLEHDFSQILWL